jgi:hypothetical protein
MSDVNVEVNIKLKDQIPDPSALNDLFGQIKSKIGEIQIPGIPNLLERSKSLFRMQRSGPESFLRMFPNY